MIRLLISLLIFSFLFPAHSRSLIDLIDNGSNDRTDILAVYQNGDLLYQEYRNGYQPNQKHKLWSMSKSITSLMVARAVKEGRLTTKDSICEHISMTEIQSTAQCETSIEDLLYWQSGTVWAENYIGFQGDKSSVLSGQYGEGIKDFSKYYFSLPYSPEIEFNWNYSTGDSHILAYLLKKVYSPMEYESLPWDLLFDPLGIDQATFERDHQGTYLGGAYIFLSHGSLNRIAQFVLSEMKTPMVLPDGWFSQMLKARPNAILTHEMIKDKIAPAIPGGHWWLNQPTESDNQVIPWPEAPADTFAAFGVFGQMMFIIPSENLVIIRLAQDIAGGFDKANLLDVVRKYVQGEKL